MFEITIKSEFSSAHRLVDYKGECENCHGHNWKVAVTVAREKLDRAGMVMDFKELQDCLDGFLKKLDHSNLNDLPYFQKLNPTSENVVWVIYQNLAHHFAEKQLKIRKVEVWESDSSSAGFIPDNQ